MVLKELGEEEKAEFARMKTSPNQDTWQVLLAMIAIDLMGNKINGIPVTFQQLVDNISKEGLHHIDIDFCENDPYPLPNIIFSWIGKMMIIQGIEKNKTKRNDARAITFGLLEAVCEQCAGRGGKKQMNMLKFYEEINTSLKQETGHELYELPVETYRFIITCLEYIGIKRKASIGEGIIDVSQISQNDIG